MQISSENRSPASRNSGKDSVHEKYTLRPQHQHRTRHALHRQPHPRHWRARIPAAAYNAGEDRIALWKSERTYDEVPELVESIPFTETREYVQIVLRNTDYVPRPLWRQRRSRPSPPHHPAATRYPLRPNPASRLTLVGPAIPLGPDEGREGGGRPCLFPSSPRTLVPSLRPSASPLLPALRKIFSRPAFSSLWPTLSSVVVNSFPSAPLCYIFPCPLQKPT